MHKDRSAIEISISYFYAFSCKLKAEEVAVINVKAKSIKKLEISAYDPKKYIYRYFKIP